MTRKQHSETLLHSTSHQHQSRPSRRSVLIAAVPGGSAGVARSWRSAWSPGPVHAVRAAVEYEEW